MKHKFFKILRLRGYKKLFLKRLLRKVKHSSRISFLKFPPKYVTAEKFCSKRKETEIIENAEQILVVSSEVCSIFVLFQLKTLRQKCLFLFLCFFTGSNTGRKWGTIEPYPSWLFTPLSRGDKKVVFFGKAEISKQ